VGCRDGVERSILHHDVHDRTPAVVVGAPGPWQFSRVELPFVLEERIRALHARVPEMLRLTRSWVEINSYCLQAPKTSRPESTKGRARDGTNWDIAGPP
jgi:hypothetical protein